MSRRIMLWVGVAVLLATLLAAVAMQLSGYDVVADLDHSRAFHAPDSEHLLGTDHLGRDVLMRLLLASGQFVFPGTLATLFCAAIAVPLGGIAGYRGGKVASVIRYGFTVVQSLPRFVLVLLVCSIYGNDPVIIAIVAGVAYAPGLGEAIYTRIEALRSAEYVVANRAYGVPEWRILVVHLLWAACRRLIGRHLLGLFGFYLVLETTLSYLGGFGVAQPNPSWGNMLAFDWGFDNIHLLPMIAPAVAIWLVYAATTWVRAGLEDPSHV
ncbi:MAG: peptide/nickel transport system permease protein [Kiritimatiellia bacterium]|jgi:peptide/nickel transport system permease protein